MARISGGDKLEAALAKIAQGLESGGTLRTGFLEGASYPDGTSVAMVAAIHNYGAPAAGIPPRPFFSNMVAENKGGWPAAIAADLKATGYNAAETLGRTGELLERQLREAILDGSFVPLKEATVKRKGFSTPLIDKGIMLGSIKSEVS